METINMLIFTSQRGKARLQAVLFKSTALDAARIGTKSLLNRAESGALHCGTYILDARFCTRQFLFRSPPPISSSTRWAPLLYQPPPFLGGGRYSDGAHRLFHGAVVLWSSPVTLWMKAGLPLTACEKLKPQRGVPRA